MKDITSTIERLPHLEERLGISFEGLSAFVELDGDTKQHEVVVNGEVHATSGGKLTTSVAITIAAYGADGRVVGSEEYWCDDDEFFALAVFQMLVTTPASPARIRVFPRQS